MPLTSNRIIVCYLLPRRAGDGDHHLSVGQRTGAQRGIGVPGEELAQLRLRILVELQVRLVHTNVEDHAVDLRAVLQNHVHRHHLQLEGYYQDSDSGLEDSEVGDSEASEDSRDSEDSWDSESSEDSEDSDYFPQYRDWLSFHRPSVRRLQWYPFLNMGG